MIWRKTLLGWLLALGFFFCGGNALAQDRNNANPNDNQPVKQPEEKKGPEEKKAPEPPKYTGVRFPNFSPDGTLIAFSLYGDLWVIPANGGLARRLTLHEDVDLKPVWSPDGKQIAFSSNRNGNWDVFITDLEGSKPRQITFHSADDLVSDWSPDGNHLMIISTRQGSFMPWLIPLNGGPAQLLTSESANEPIFSPDGKQIVFNWGYYERDILSYNGSSNWNIFLLTIGNELPQQLTDYDGNDMYPGWSTDGKKILYVSENKSVFNIWEVGANGGKPTQISDFKDGIIRNLRVSKDGKKLVFERNFELWTFNLADKKTEKLIFEIKSDDSGQDTYQKTYSAGANAPTQSPDGREIAFAMNGDIWSMPSSGGYARRITSGAGLDEQPRWSPDGKWITFYSDRAGNNDIWIVRPNGGELRRLTDHPANDFFVQWLPDSKGVVFCSERSGNRDIWKVALDGSPAEQLTNTPHVEDDPCVSPDGKWLYFDSDRGGNLDIWRMPISGGEAVRIAGGPQYDQCPVISPDGRFLMYSNSGGGIWLTYANGGPAMQVASRGDMPCWSFDSKNIFYEVGSRIASIPAPAEILAPKIIPFVATEEINRKEEMMRVFEEAWTILKNNFYDPKFHGTDWDKIKDKYRPLIANCGIKYEMYTFISQMLGELKASHLGIYGPGKPNKENTGIIGARLEPKENLNEGLSVVEVIPNSPADKAWLRKGDIVLSIDGKKLLPSEDYELLLNGKVNRPVKFEAAPGGDLTKKREFTITPFDLGSLMGLLSNNWEDNNAKLVTAQTDGKVAYFHLRNMMGGELERFKSTISQFRDKQALVLDLRNNGGGNVHEEVLDILRRKVHSSVRPRGATPQSSPELAWGKPVVLLINQNSHSDAEIFPFAFKLNELGTVVGVPTLGGVIGTNNTHLSDGSVFRIPSIGWFTTEGENLENFGVKPDIIIEETPADRLNNRDPQLTKAIEVILQEIEKQNKKAAAKAGNKQEQNAGANPPAPQAPAKEQPPAKDNQDKKAESEKNNPEKIDSKASKTEKKEGEKNELKPKSNFQPKNIL